MTWHTESLVTTAENGIGRLSENDNIQKDHDQVAGELEIVTAVLRWGEHNLIRRLEEREPNLLSHTTHSISRKGVKKRDLNDLELRDVLAELLPLVRIDHVIPYNNETLASAIRRGLVSSPPSHMLEDEDTGPRHTSSSWIRNKHSSIYVKPRLFTPYFEDAKAVLDERLSQGHDHDPGRVRTIQMSSIPDTLYMVEDRHYPQSTGIYNPPSCSTVDIIAGTIPVPDSNTLHQMLQREQELQNCQLTQRAYCLPYCDRRAVNCHIQLRTVREFGLPDSTIEVLQNSQSYFPSEPVTARPKPSISNTPLQRYLISSSRHKSTPPMSRRHHQGNFNKPIQRVSPTRPRNGVNKENVVNPINDGALSDVMPDIAMASSSLNQMHIQDEFELDIGDGSTHHGTTYI